jgi:hypothetical protein
MQNRLSICNCKNQNVPKGFIVPSQKCVDDDIKYLNKYIYIYLGINFSPL